MIIIVSFIRIIMQILSLIIIVKVFLSYFLEPYHPIRNMLDRFIDPVIRPIQKLIPPIGSIDFSPLILLIIIQLLGSIIISIIQIAL